MKMVRKVRLMKKQSLDEKEEYVEQEVEGGNGPIFWLVLDLNEAEEVD